MVVRSGPAARRFHRGEDGFDKRSCMSCQRSMLTAEGETMTAQACSSRGQGALLAEQRWTRQWHFPIRIACTPASRSVAHMMTQSILLLCVRMALSPRDPRYVQLRSQAPSCPGAAPGGLVVLSPALADVCKDRAHEVGATAGSSRSTHLRSWERGAGGGPDGGLGCLRDLRILGRGGGQRAGGRAGRKGGGVKTRVTSHTPRF